MTPEEKKERLQDLTFLEDTLMATIRSTGPGPDHSLRTTLQEVRDAIDELENA